MNGWASFRNWVSDERGVTMIEYGLLAALIAIVSIATITGLGINLNALYQTVCGALATAVGAAGC